MGYRFDRLCLVAVAAFALLAGATARVRTRLRRWAWGASLAAVFACGCTPSARATAATVGVVSLATADGAARLLVPWIVDRESRIPLECDAACAGNAAYAPCLDACLIVMRKPVNDATTALRAYLGAVEVARAGVATDLAAAAAAIVATAKAVGVMP